MLLRTSPNETLLKGCSITSTNVKAKFMRLPARYQPATQYLGELLMKPMARTHPPKGYTFDLSYSKYKWIEFGTLLDRILRTAGSDAQQENSSTWWAHNMFFTTSSFT
jgi:hypothetical protein